MRVGRPMLRGLRSLSRASALGVGREGAAENGGRSRWEGKRTQLLAGLEIGEAPLNTGGGWFIESPDFNEPQKRVPSFNQTQTP